MEPQKNNRLILLILGALVIVGGVYAFLTYNSTSPTDWQPTGDQNLIATSTTLNIPTDWKTYKNDKYGFEFRYPSSLYVHEGSYGHGGEWVFVSLGATSTEEYGYELCGSSNNSEYGFNVHVLSQSDSREAQMSNMFGKNEEKLSDEISADNIRTIKFKHSQSPGYYLIIIKNKIVYGVDYVGCADIGSIPTAQIFSTFKFAN